MKIIVFECTGTPPGLLMNNPAKMSPTGTALDTKRIPKPEDEAAAARYLTEDKRYFRFPVQGFKSSFVSGGVGRRIGKRSATAVLKASIFPAEEWAELLDPHTRELLPADTYELDVRRVVIQGNGVLRGRPKIFPWLCRVPFEVDATIDNVQVLLDIGALAGRMVGVGDYRPATGGPFGRYTVSLAD